MRGMLLKYLENFIRRITGIKNEKENNISNVIGSVSITVFCKREVSDHG
jgi:hypothetical protein